MLLHFGLQSLQAEWSGSVVCIGVFDGVHVGHQSVIHEAVRQASEHQSPCVLVTFDRHPSVVLAPERAPLPIASLAQNLDWIEQLGVAVSLVLPFDRSLSRMAAVTFFHRIMLRACRATRVVVGDDFAMGHGRVGDWRWLADRIETTVQPAITVNGMRVSSSAIRSAIESGNLEQTESMLGRPFELSGIVVSGKKLGRTLGFPTANLARSMDQVMPPNGVYAATARAAGAWHKAAVSIGMRPAVGGTSRTIEAHLLDYEGGPLYGKGMRLRLQQLLREERSFDSVEALKLQIAADIAKIRTILSNLSV